MLALGAYRTRWLAFCETFLGADEETRARLVADAVRDGLPPGEPSSSFDPSARERGRAEAAVIQAAGLFDTMGYWAHNKDLFWDLCGRNEQLEHFVLRGWKELRHPSADFDMWSYWCDHLDATREDVNPVVHYAVEGRRAGLSPLPSLETLPPPAAPGPDHAPRRVCLFAGYDGDGVVDDTVVTYIADLSRFADVYYLADCELAPGELEKLAPYTQGAWGIRHGRYDFGSYSMLAKDLVGWDVVDGYDELMFANDSCFLVQPLDQVFAKMDATTCDWWGLQATYDDFDDRAFDALGRRLGLDEVGEQMRELALWRYSDFIHVGSYFLCYRRRVHTDPRFRKRLDEVASQSEKVTIILKYEIGFSRLLILAGFTMATFVDGILAYHPVYRASAFELMHEGFPLLKRQLLTENPFETPDLHRWKERVLEAAPGADVEAMDRSMRRTAPPWSLVRSFGFRSRRDGTAQPPGHIGPAEFADEDRWVPKFDHWWIFPVDPRTGVLSGAVRAVFEEVRDDPSVKKVVLLGGHRVKLGGDNVAAVPSESTAGQMYGLRAATVFCTIGPRADVNHPLGRRHHRFLDLGHATGLQPAVVALAGSSLAGERPLPPADYEAHLTRALVTAHDGAGTDYPDLDPDGLWAIGSPRVDLLLRDEEGLFGELRSELTALRGLLKGRRLVLLSPARGGEIDLAALATWAGTRADEVVVAVLPTSGATPRVPSPLVDLMDVSWLEGTLGLRAPLVPEMVWRLADVLVSGTPADLADFSPTGRPAVASPGTPDLPFAVPADTGALVAAVEHALSDGQVEAPYAEWGRALHALSDGRSAARLVDRLKQTYLPWQEWVAEADAPAVSDA
ncbi:rhamnan synthesis F family protein [Nocardioides allogilvus]|uniref:rhamnan synthesis F family protein n=1 Tax=Nocardioides allogilvus TaxID=2072017 RepID=UPI000D2FC533|nr:rhamnan synthesis F family protein [Nocardioides allogilvus]